MTGGLAWLLSCSAQVRCGAQLGATIVCFKKSRRKMKDDEWQYEHLHASRPAPRPSRARSLRAAQVQRGGRHAACVWFDVLMLCIGRGLWVLGSAAGSWKLEDRRIDKTSSFTPPRRNYWAEN